MSLSNMDSDTQSPTGSVADRRYRVLFEQAAAGMERVSLDDGRLLEVNPALCRMLGYAPEQLLSRTYLDITHPDDHAAEQPLVGELATGDRTSYTVEKRYLRADGSRLWVRVISSRAEEPGLRPYRISVVQDITERKRAVDALAVREAHLSALIEQTTVGVAEVDEHGRFLLVNDCYCRLVGRTRDELLSLRMQDVTHPDDLNENERLFRRALETGEPFDIEKRYIRPDGSAIWVRNSVSRLRGTGEAPFTVFAVSVDITDRKRAEERQRLIVQESNHRVKNTLAIIQSIARQTFGRRGNVELAAQEFDRRINALAVAHEVLTRASWEHARMAEIILGAMAPHDPGEGRVTIEGPDLLLPARATVTVSMAIHELATNASKFGSLSGSTGQVHIRWYLEQGRLKLIWREQGGPKVRKPTRSGFGSRMVESGLAAELGGHANIEFRPEGLVCKVDAPLPPQPGQADAS